MDSCTQIHELLGTKRMYNFFDNMDIPIARHTHDDKRSVSKFVEDERPDTTNSIDVWHETLKIPTKFRKISSGPNYAKGKTWNDQLFDKGSSVKTHVNFSLRN